MAEHPWDFDWDDWVEPAYPMTGPAFDWGGIRYITIHYPGSPKVLPLSVDLERDEVRREQRMYTDDPNRGYSVGYNAKVFQDGNKWKLRGDSLRCAANGNQATNIPGFAIQVRVAIDETPSEALIESVRELVAWCREKAGRDLPINGHRDLKPTACPGDKAYALIQTGVFEPREAPVVVAPPPINPPIHDEEDYLMAAIQAIYTPGPKVTRPNPKWFVLRADGGIRHASGPDVEHGRALKVPEYTIGGDEHYDQLDTASQK